MRAIFPTHLTDQELVTQVHHFVRCEREATSQLVAHLAELDARRLYLAAGFSSLFTYCCEVLGLSEHEAYNRIEVARAARRFPIILTRLANAAVNLTAVRLLAPMLTPDNHEELLSEAAGRSKREVEELLARRFPRPDAPASIRRLPPARPLAPVEPDRDEAGLAPAPERPRSAPVLTAGRASAATSVPAAIPPARPTKRAPVATPLAADRYQIRFTASAATHDKLRQAQDLLRHALPSGDPAEIFDRALTALLRELTRRKCASVRTPARTVRATAAGSRHIPANVRRVVWARDQGRCRFVGASGRRCGERAFLEFHHVRAFAAGGQATAENIQLRCRAHNAFEATVTFGRGATRSGTSSGVRSQEGVGTTAPA